MNDAVVITAIVAAVVVVVGILILTGVAVTALVKTHGSSLRAAGRYRRGENHMTQVLVEKLAADPVEMTRIHSGERNAESRIDGQITRAEVKTETPAPPDTIGSTLPDVVEPPTDDPVDAQYNV